VHGYSVERDATGVDKTTGEPLPFETFFESERPRLFATLVLIANDRSVAEDLMQEAFARVWERWDRVQAHPDASGYLYRTALNLVRHRRRRILKAPPLAPEVACDKFTTVERREDLYAALRRLTPRQPAAVVLTELLDMDANAAGKVLGVRAVTVRSLASQGRASIRSWGATTDE
jgi:RNA polymerase sigma factor (sigma-70 family)